MKPRRTHRSTNVFSLEGGTEDNDLWVEVAEQNGLPVICSTWEPTDEERAAIAAGANIELQCWGKQPPVNVRTSDIPLGKAP